MKRLAAILSIPVLLLSGCERGDDSSMPVSDRAISFTASAPYNPTSRGVTTTQTLDEFSVYSFTADDGRPYMTDLRVRRDSRGLWTYSPQYFWPLDHKLNFYAFSPSRDKIKSDAPDASAGGPDIPNFVNDGHTDLLYAVNMGLDSDTRQVKMNFRHALSKVQVSFRPRPGAGLSVDIAGTRLENVARKASFRYPGQTTEPGDVTAATGVWSAWSDTGDVSLSSTLFEDIQSNIVINPDGYMFCIPQSLEASGGTRLTVKCRMERDGVPIWPVTGSEPGYDAALDMAEITIPLSSDAVREWRQGHAYDYTITLDNPVKEYIDFDITVDEYNDFVNPDTPDNRADISFDAVLPDGTNIAKFGDFKIWGAASGLPLLEARSVTREGTDWNYSPAVAWPAGDVSFYGLSQAGWIADDKRYSNFGVRFSTDSDYPLTVTDYDTGSKTGSNGAADLQYAVTPGRRYNGKPVEMNFRHALSQIKIYYRTNSWEDVTMRVRGTYFRVNNTKGTFTLPVTGTQYGNPADSGSWTSRSPGIIQIAKANPLTYYGADYQTACTTGPQVFVVPQKVSPWDRRPNIPDETETGQFLFLRAQFIRQKDDAETLVWPVQGDEAGLVSQYSDAYLYVPLTDRDMYWEPGYTYIYEISLGVPNQSFTKTDYNSGMPYGNTNIIIHLQAYSDFGCRNFVYDRWIYFSGR